MRYKEELPNEFFRTTIDIAVQKNVDTTSMVLTGQAMVRLLIQGKNLYAYL